MRLEYSNVVIRDMRTFHFHSSKIKAGKFKAGVLFSLLGLTNFVGSGQAQNNADTAGPLNYGRASSSAVKSQAGGPQDQALSKVRWEQNLNAQLPFDAKFKDETGRDVQLGQYFKSHRPVYLAMIFYNCTMLCSQVLNGTMVGLKETGYTPGKDYDVVVVSIDPKETPAIAASKKKNYLAEYGFTGTENGWHFLTGTEANIQKVTNAAGYFYTYDKSTQQYAHPGGIVLATPQGKIARYFTGVMFEPRDLKFSMIEASENKVGSPIDMILLRCFHYDPAKGSYSVAIMKVVRLIAALFVVLIGGGLALWVRRDMKKEKRELESSATAGGSTPVTTP